MRFLCLHSSLLDLYIILLDFLYSLWYVRLILFYEWPTVILFGLFKRISDLMGGGIFSLKVRSINKCVLS